MRSSSSEKILPSSENSASGSMYVVGLCGMGACGYVSDALVGEVVVGVGYLFRSEGGRVNRRINGLVVVDTFTARRIGRSSRGLSGASDSGMSRSSPFCSSSNEDSSLSSLSLE